MTRTSLYKAGYFGIVLITSAVLIVVIGKLLASIVVALVIGIVLLLPDWVLARYWRDLLRGLDELKRGNYEKSRTHSQSFLDQLPTQPWLKLLIWLGSSAYSRDPKALALNNLGVANIGLMEYDTARKNLENSIAIDGQNPVPYFNLGVLATRRGEAAEAATWSAKAEALGYSGWTSDPFSGALRWENAASVSQSDVATAANDTDTPRFIVELVNDDQTPMDFVIYLLQAVFGKTRGEATVIMWETHRRGRGVCGTFGQAEAERKVLYAQEIVQRHNQPLVCALRQVTGNG